MELLIIRLTWHCEDSEIVTNQYHRCKSRDNSVWYRLDDRNLILAGAGIIPFSIPSITARGFTQPPIFSSLSLRDEVELKAEYSCNSLPRSAEMKSVCSSTSYKKRREMSPVTVCFVWSVVKGIRRL
jgi:hypothetical protein